MNDDDHRQYNRKRATGAFPWDLEELNYQEQTSNTQKNTGAMIQPLPDNFEPDQAIIDYLTTIQGVPIQFIAQQLIDFRLYWKETGEARKAWQNKFKTHVIYRWKKDNDERRQNTHKSTIDKLNDTSWEEDNWLEQLNK